MRLNVKILRTSRIAGVVSVLFFSLALFDAGANEKFKSISGQVLVANPSMLDPRFARTVIYVYEHSRGGALGLVVNKPVGIIEAESLAEQLGILEEVEDKDIRMFWGGPLQTRQIMILHSSDYVTEQSKNLSNGMYLSFSKTMLRAILEGNGPKKNIFTFGYAGWGPGQLDGELHREDWMLLEVGIDFIFSENPLEMWDEARKLYTIDL